jgi:hypothetical protein
LACLSLLRWRLHVPLRIGAGHRSAHQERIERRDDRVSESPTAASGAELVVLESGVYGDRDATGTIPGTDPVRVQKNDQALMMFNGRLEHTALTVHPGDLIRAYVVNVGPGVSAIHVMGTILDAVHDGATELRNVQTYGIPAGSGAIVEFRIPEPGMYGLVDHDRLSYLPYGMVLSFDATGGHPHATM